MRADSAGLTLIGPTDQHELARRRSAEKTAPARGRLLLQRGVADGQLQRLQFRVNRFERRALRPRPRDFCPASECIRVGRVLEVGFEVVERLELRADVRKEAGTRLAVQRSLDLAEQRAGCLCELIARERLRLDLLAVARAVAARRSPNMGASSPK